VKARRWRFAGATALVVLTGLVAGCASDTAPKPAAEPAPAATSMLPDMDVPTDNPITPEKIELGKQLFFDTRISDNGEFSCENCHLPEMGWGDGLALSINAAGNTNTRHSPTLYNVGYYSEFYWDGRMPTLEDQVLAAWRGQAGATPDMIAERLAGIPGYAEQFQSAMGTGVTADAIVDALSTFIRSLEADGSPWDQYELGDTTAVSADAIAGFDVFSLDDKANCTLCHLPPLYTDTLFHNIGVGFDSDTPDLGRGAFLARQEPPAEDAAEFNGAFKTPTLRNVTLHAPYFHDGSAATLEEAVDYVLSGGHANEWLDERMQPRTITDEEKAQLMEFLRALTSDTGDFERPELPPDAE
jgi:cytochrome c peroxidase